MVPEQASDDPFVGQELAGKYRVVARLGAGGFGTVYSAINLALGTEVAVKVGRGPKADVRMLREARAASRLRSQHTVRVFDVGELSGGALFIVMELLPGRSLREWLATHGPLPVEVAVQWVSQICTALHEAHAHGLVHRDLKPSNLFVVEGPTLETHVKLLDFGLVKSVEASLVEATQSARVLGTPQYMSPEQVRGIEVTHLSDIWSLGVVLYECLSCRLPFERDTASGTLVAIASDPPRPLAEVTAGLPEAVQRAVARCLRKSPDERFRSVRELMAALAPFGRASLSGFAPQTADEQSTWDTHELEVTPRESGARNVPVAARADEQSRFRAVAFLLLAVSAIGVVYWLGGRSLAPEPELGATPPSAGVVLRALPRAAAQPPAPGRLESVPPLAGAAVPSAATTSAAPLPASSAPSTRPRTRPSLATTARAPALPSSRLVLDPDF